YPPIRVLHPSGVFGLFLICARGASIGFSEELIARGYLIRRLEALTNSRSSSVAISAGIFALLHSYQGVFGVWGAFGTGILYGVLFAWTGRLLPVVVSHALFDIVAMIYESR